MGNSWDEVIGTQAYEKSLTRAQTLANDNGYVLNPDEERMQKVVGLMTMNYNSHGKYYCPCKQSHPLDPKKDTTCPCTQWKDEVKKDGYCFCKLFFKKGG